MTFTEGPVPSTFSSCTLSPWEMVVVVMVVVALVPMVVVHGRLGPRPNDRFLRLPPSPFLFTAAGLSNGGGRRRFFVCNVVAVCPVCVACGF